MKKIRSTRRRFVPRRTFTLIELMAVIGIMLLLLGIAVAPFGKMLGGTGVPAGARMVSAQLRLARQYALSQRETVAVVMPRYAGPAEYRCRAFRTCEVDSGGTFVSWIPETRWEFLPDSVVIFEADNDYGDDESSPLDDEGTYDTVDDVEVDGNTYELRAVIFEPNGRLSGGLRRYVTLFEGTYDNGALVARNQRNIKAMEIDSYTGRVTYVDPLSAP